ncbi:DUF6544 family protein [Flavobacterium sp.]|uniref:DUF6544 family protein n=1 Tax=Flavobacterium sp. TaxID=239 RepID=UPI00374CE33E
MKTTLIILAIIVLILLIGKIYFSIRFKNQVEKLFSNVEKSNRSFSIKQLEGLPEPVQRYFNYVLKQGQPYINFVRLTHDGFFKTDLKKDFIKITGEQYFSTKKPQFIWKGVTSMFTARDFFIDEKGGLIATLFNIYNVVDAKGTNYDNGELQRWLAESVWFPTNLLPSDKVSWTAIDENSAKLLFHSKAVSFEFIVSFNAIGEITTMESYRFMTKTRKEKWICRMSNYKEINNIKIPFSDQALWKLNDVEYCYAKFEIQKIEYNIPEKF